jgi:hypothetical protein
MSNKYIKEAAKKNTDSRLPKTLEEFSLLSQADASRVPMSHIQKLRKEFNEEKFGKTKSSFVKGEIKWD